MATKYWQGGAAAVADVWTATVGGTIEAGDVFTLTCAGVPVTFTATTTVIADVVAGLVAAWNASTHPAHEEITATDDSPDVVLTAKTAGVPVTITAATTEAGGGAADDQTFTIAHTVSATGPNFADNGANWSGGTVPASSDVVYVLDGPDILYGLDQDAIELAALHIKPTTDMSIGLARWHVDPDDPTEGYAEYRDRYWQIEMAALYIDATNATRVQVDIADHTGTAIRVYGTGTALDDGEPVKLRTTGAAGTEIHTVAILSGRVALAPEATDAGVFDTVTIGEHGSASDAASTYLEIGPGATISALMVMNGTVETWAAVSTNASVIGPYAILTHHLGTLALVNVQDGGTLDQRGGNITTCHIGGTFDAKKHVGATTVTTLHLYDGAVWNDPTGYIGVTNTIQLHECTLADVTWNSRLTAAKTFQHIAYET